MSMGLVSELLLLRQILELQLSEQILLLAQV